MISRAHRDVPLWQRQLADAVTDLDELLSLLDLDRQDVDVPSVLATRGAQQQFPLRVPRGFVARMRRGDARDPLLLQVLPRDVEQEAVAGFSRDPLAEVGTSKAETEASPGVPGLLHKYRGRALLVLTGACAIHCRYCFRRHFPYADQAVHRSQHQAALDYLAADPSITEVLLSGGDPLSLHDDTLARLAGELAAIPHLRRLRVHSRQPVVLPARVDDALLAWLTGGRLTPVLVLHANHARELDAEVAAAIGRLRASGVTVLNQAVLLRGVNDNVETLARLSERLFECGALPYYLNLLDPVQGAHHFDVPELEALGLYGGLLARLPGYLVPKLVREIPGAASKVPLQMQQNRQQAEHQP